MRDHSISQIPIMKDGKFVGSLDDIKVYQLLIEQPDLRYCAVSTIMQPGFPIVKASTSIEELSKMINRNCTAVLVELEDGEHHIVTRHDLISAIA